MGFGNISRKILPSKLVEKGGYLKFRWKCFWRINIVKTVYVNFKMLSIRQAVKLPICLYGNIRLIDTSGKVVIESKEIRHNMIKIGYRWLDLWPVSYLPTQFSVSGTVFFGGRTAISGGVNLAVEGKNAILKIGKFCIIGGGTVVKSLDKMVIGDYTRIAGGCTIMNSNMHYVKNVVNGSIARKTGKIIIGHHCWINAYSVVAKGAVIPNYSVTSRNCFISKDYTELGENLFLVGSPAEVKSSKVQRLMSDNQNMLINKFFSDYPNENIYFSEPGVIENDTDIEEQFFY